MLPHPISHKIAICCVSHCREGANWMDNCNPGAIVVLEIYLNVLHYSCVRSQAPLRLLGYLSKMDMRFKKLLPKESSRGTICRSEKHP